MVARLWLDRSCVASLSDVDDEVLRSWVNIKVGAVFIDIEAPDVPVALARFIQDKADWPREGSILEDHSDSVRQLAAEYHALGRTVLLLTLRVCNRFLGWLYAVKGQYWLAERPATTNSMMSHNNEWRARVSVEGGPWARWCPPNRDIGEIRLPESARWITEADWAPLQAHVSGRRKPPLVGELLSNAELLASEGHGRSAVIEAVSGLEVALNDFARGPIPSVVTRLQNLGTSAIHSLPASVRHLRITASVRYLLPLLFEPSVLDRDALEGVSDVLDLRNSIVHSGQRTVEEDQVLAGIRAIRIVTDILAQATVRDDVVRP